MQPLGICRGVVEGAMWQVAMLAAESPDQNSAHSVMDSTS